MENTKRVVACRLGPGELPVRSFQYLEPLDSPSRSRNINSLVARLSHGGESSAEVQHEETSADSTREPEPFEGG